MATPAPAGCLGKMSTSLRGERAPHRPQWSHADEEVELKEGKAARIACVEMLKKRKLSREKAPETSTGPWPPTCMHVAAHRGLGKDLPERSRRNGPGAGLVGMAGVPMSHRRSAGRYRGFQQGQRGGSGPQ